jgi:hypothetical protein
MTQVSMYSTMFLDNSYLLTDSKDDQLNERSGDP